MGRNARRRAEKRANRNQQGRPADPPLRPVVFLWGIPGAGKSTVARWLRDQKGYEYIDTDTSAMHGVTTSLQAAWMDVLRGQVAPAAFVRAATAGPRPVVVEYGLWAQPHGIELLRQLRAAGARAWWFDGDRAGAKEAWRKENRRASRPFDDAAWDRVVAVIDANWPRLVELFGPRTVRTVEPGPTHPSPAETFKIMTDIEAAELAGTGRSN
jgi:predicted kinase